MPDQVRHDGKCCLWTDTNYLEPQVEQLVAEQVPQDEVAVLLNFPLLEKAKVDMTRFTCLLLHFGHEIFSEVLRTNFSNS